MRLQSLGGGQWGFSEKEELLLQAGMGPSKQDKQVGCSRYAMCPHQIYGAPFTESQCCTRDYLKHFTRINSFHPQACLQNDLHPHTDTEWRTERLGTWGPLLFLLVFLLLNPGPLSSKSCIFPFSNAPEFLRLPTKKTGVQTQVYGLQSPQLMDIIFFQNEEVSSRRNQKYGWTNKDLLYSTGNSAQYSVIIQMGKEPEKE